MIRLPGVCIVCRAPVMWTGKQWKDATSLRRVHACPPDRARCGAWMRYSKERCARKPGHGYEHRTSYAMANARRRAA